MMTSKRSTPVRRMAHALLRSYLRGFPISRGKRRLLSMLWKPLSIDEQRRETILRQAPVRMSCDLTKLLQRQLYFLGSYEDECCAYWIRAAGRARTIFDVGANVGLYSLLAAASNPQARIHAFEPTPELFDSLVNNVRLNGMQNVVAHCAAIGKASGNGFLHRCTDAAGNDGMNYVEQSPSSDRDSSVEILSIDDYCRRDQIEAIDLIKIDIEGGEYDALLGAQRLLRAKAIGCVVLELLDWNAQRSGHSSIEIKRCLLEAGYRIYEPRAGKLRPVPLDRMHPRGGNVIARPEPVDAHSSAIASIQGGYTR